MMRPSALLSIAWVAATLACGGDDLVIDDDGVSSGGVRLDAIEPPNGSLLGGQSVVLEGVGLAGSELVVAFGDLSTSEVTALSSGSLLVKTPPGLAPGPVNVFVANAQGFAQRNLAFTYNDQPSITSVTPDTGTSAGGEVVVISGSGFLDNDAGDNLVSFGDERALEVTVTSDTELEAVTPPGLSFADVAVRVDNRNGAGELAAAFSFRANGLLVSVPNPLRCRGSNQHAASEAGLYFVDLDTGDLTALGLDDDLGFHSLAHDGAGGLVGLQTCTNNVMQIDLAAGTSEPAIVVNRPTGQRRHMGGLARVGGELISRGINTQFTRISAANGDVIPIGAADANPSVTLGRSALFVDSGQLFYAGLVDTAGGAVQGIAAIDPATGAQIGDGVPLAANFLINGGTLHRGELFLSHRDSSTERLVQIFRADRTTGAVDFVRFLPIYGKGFASGDL